MFATEAIADKETIVSVPFELILQEKGHPCQTVEAFAGELRKGRCSQYWPYLQFIRDTVVDVPDAWSLDELSLLDGLPPGNWRIHTHRLTAECVTLDLSDSFVARALMLYASRSGPFGMQPVFDIFNHGYNSTIHQEIFPQDPAARAHIFVTMRDIASGEEIFNVFRSGAGAGRAAVNAMNSQGMQFDGAPELFRDYGFVERPPVMWWFDAPPKAAGGGSAAESKKKRFRWVIESDAGDVYWLEPDAVDWAEFAREARKLFRELAARARAFTEAGVHCADHILGNTPEGEVPSCGMQGASERRVLLALHYRAAFERALRGALASAEEKIGRPPR